LRDCEHRGSNRHGRALDGGALLIDGAGPALVPIEETDADISSRSPYRIARSARGHRDTTLAGVNISIES
jgi:hypothetical protein